MINNKICEKELGPKRLRQALNFFGIKFPKLIRLNDIEKNLEVSSNYASELVGKLIKLGYVDEIGNSRDKRKKQNSYRKENIERFSL